MIFVTSVNVNIELWLQRSEIDIEISGGGSFDNTSLASLPLLKRESWIIL